MELAHRKQQAIILRLVVSAGIELHLVKISEKRSEIQNTTVLPTLVLLRFFFSLSLLHNMRHFILGFRRFKTFLFSFSFPFFFFNRRTVAGATEKVAGDIAGRRRFLTTLVSYVMLAFSALHFPSI